MKYRVLPFGPGEWEEWNSLVNHGEAAMLFSTASYLRHIGPVERLGVFDESGGLVGGMAVPTMEDGGQRHARRTSYVSPYFGPVFRPIAGSRVNAERVRRCILRALIAYLISSFASVELPLNPLITDMVPFQQEHFQLELRSTYELELSSLDETWKRMSPSARNHIRSASVAEVVTDPSLECFNFAAALDYESETGAQQWVELVHSLVAEDSALVLVARHKGRAIGGIFIAFGLGRAYNLLSYFDSGSDVRGVPSRLIWAAAENAAARGLSFLDLEGSVLPSIESFFQSFGGLRRPYFQIHWFADRSLQKPILYEYDR
jgi:hypothetical protein